MSSDVAPTRRVVQVVLVVCTLGTSWFGMQAVHELGHLVGAWMSQATVERVVLHPQTISRTGLRYSVHSLAGQLLGMLVLCVSAAFLRRVLPRGQWTLHRSRIMMSDITHSHFWLSGLDQSLDRVGDCGEMLRHGSPHWTLWFFGSTMAPAGLWLWNGQSPYFGWGGDLGKIDPRAVRVSVIAFVSLIALGLLIGNR